MHESIVIQIYGSTVETLYRASDHVTIVILFFITYIEN